MERSFQVSEKTINSLLGFLQTCRYDQVAPLIQSLSTEIAQGAKGQLGQQIKRVDPPGTPEPEEKKA